MKKVGHSYHFLRGPYGASIEPTLGITTGSTGWPSLSFCIRSVWCQYWANAWHNCGKYGLAIIQLSALSRNCLNIYWKCHLVLNDVNSKSQVDRVDMVEFSYHGEWYTLLIIDIIDWNDLEKFVYSSWYIRGEIGVNRFYEKSFVEPP